jgi:hypothetical protein
MGSALSNYDYDFVLNQQVETAEGQGIVVGRTKFGFPDGIYLVQLSSEQRWMYPEEMAPVEE